MTATFDVFISYNGRDKAIVERIAERLRREGVRPFLDVWDLTPGGRWQRELADGLERSATCALFVGPHALGDWQLEELELALVRANQRDGFRVFPVLLPGIADPFDAKQLPPFVSTRTWVDLRAGASSRRGMQDLLNAVKGVAPGAPVDAQPLSGSPPYRGLETFHEEHSELFFGRERDVQRLLEILKSSPLLCAVGPSGSGKSSLVRAGLIPRLREGALPDVAEWTTCVMRPGAHPLEGLAAELVRVGGGRSMRETVDELAADRQALHLGVSLALGADAPDRRVLLLVDQLEEVFTLCRDEREREQFFANILHAVFASGGRTVVVMTMRADFYGKCADYPELAQRTARSLALIGPMQPDELRQAIEEPARRVGLFFEPGLVQTILADVGADAGALPLLEHALLEIWRRRVGDMLTLDAYVEAGRVEGALAKRAEGVFAGFASAQQEAARRLMLRLTQPGEGTGVTRRRARIDEVAGRRDREDFDAVLRELVDARLLTTSDAEAGVEPVVEVSHEALTRGWPRLRGWIDAAGQDLVVQRRVTEAAADWQRLERDDSALYRGAPLAEALALRERDPATFNDSERAFLDASIDREDESRLRELANARALAAAQRRAKHGLVGVVGVLLAGVVAATAFALAAFAARDRADRSRARAVSAQFADAAIARADSDPELALTLARDAAALHRSPQTEAALRKALASPLEAVLRGHTAPVDTLELSSDGRFVATGTERDDDVRVWDLDRARQLLRRDPRLGSLQAVALSPRGALLLVAGDDGVALWDVASGKALGRLPGKALAVIECAFTASGENVACVGANEARIWRVDDRKLLAAPSVEGSAAGTGVGSAISDDGAVVALSTPRGEIRPFSARSGRPLPVLRGGGRPLVSVQLDATGSRVLERSDDGRIVVRDVAGGRVRLRPKRSPGTQAFLQQSGRIVVMLERRGDDGAQATVVELETATQRKLVVPGLDASAVVRDDFAPSGRLAVETVDGGAAVLDLATGRTLAELGGASVSARYGPRGGRILTTEPSGTVTAWNPHVTPMGREGSTFAGASFSPRGDVVAAAEGARLRLRSAASGAPAGPRPAPISATLPRDDTGDAQVAMAFSGDGRWLRANVAPGSMHEIDLRSQRARTTSIRGVARAISENGSYVTLDNRVAEVREAGSDDVALRVRASGKDGGFHEAALSRDGRRVALATDGGTVQVRDVAGATPLPERKLGGEDVFFVALSPDGKRLAALDASDALWTVDLTTGRQHKLPNRTSEPDGLSISPDGSLLLVRGMDRTTLYDANSGREVRRFEGAHPAVTVDASSARVAIAVGRGPVVVARCDECGAWQELRERADRRVRRTLTRAERRRFEEGNT